MGSTGRINNGDFVDAGADPVLEIEASPDSPYAANSSSYDAPRCKFPPSTITVTNSNAAIATATVTWTVTEPLLHSSAQMNLRVSSHV